MRHMHVQPRLDAEDPYAGVPSTDPQPIDNVLQAHTIDAVRCCLRALPDNERKSVHLAFYGDLSHREIARDLGTPLGTVKSWVRSAYEALRPTLRDYRPS